MDWLILIPVIAAAIWLYVWFRPPSGSGLPEYDVETKIEAAAPPEAEGAAAVAAIHAADQQKNTALIRS